MTQPPLPFFEQQERSGQLIKLSDISRIETSHKGDGLNLAPVGHYLPPLFIAILFLDS